MGTGTLCDSLWSSLRASDSVSDQTGCFCRPRLWGSAIPSAGRRHLVGLLRAGEEPGDSNTQMRHGRERRPSGRESEILMGLFSRRALSLNAAGAQGDRHLCKQRPQPTPSEVHAPPHDDQMLGVGVPTGGSSQPTTAPYVLEGAEGASPRRS